MEKGNQIFLAVSIISIIMLVLAIPDMPYGYYTFLRIIICISAIINVVYLLGKNKIIFMVIFGLIAILFNPIIKVTFEKETWVIIDMIVALIYLINAILLFYKSIQSNKHINIV